jgi:hypothetical protein
MLHGAKSLINLKKLQAILIISMFFSYSFSSSRMYTFHSTNIMASSFDEEWDIVNVSKCLVNIVV